MSNTLYIDTIETRDGSSGIIVADSYDTSVVYGDFKTRITPEDTFSHLATVIMDEEIYTNEKLEDTVRFAIENCQSICVDGHYIDIDLAKELYNGK